MRDFFIKRRSFDKEGCYKGFYKHREHCFKLSGIVHLTFTNGHKEIFASGTFKEQALKNIFDKIDNSKSNSIQAVYKTPAD